MIDKKVLPYGRQDIDEEDIKYVAAALGSDFLTTGPLVEKFEEDFCKYTNSKFTISCSNGTSALHLACLAIGLKKGDWVIVPSITFLATANAVRFSGAEVLFCDVDESSGLMTPNALREAISVAKRNNFRLKAVISVHLTGKPVDLASLKTICDLEKLILISDSCHALGGVYRGSPIGACNYEDFNTFSFHPVKAITTGEGGAVTTNKKEYAEKMKLMRSHNMERKKPNNGWWAYDMHSLGYNYRMSDVQCALGISQLKKIDNFVSKRETLVKFYNSKFGKLAPFIKTPKNIDRKVINRVGWHLYSVLIDFDKLKMSRENLMKKLLDKGIRTQVHYIPVHTQPYYTTRYGLKTLPGSNKYFRKTLSLPLFTQMKVAELEYVVEQIYDLTS